ncbi:MAG: methionine--tRNA ligase [Planctomycetes bacterium]|nr:methionine--tRNA ligase [Planctomycetota bacterium]
MPERFYVTTPIYYVNDRPHIGHVYTTTVADIVARYERLRGKEVFFLTGTDEHAAKVVDSAEAHDMTAQEWADRNAAQFQKAFEDLGMSHDDFIRTTEDRHKTRVLRYVQAMMESGDVYLGEYEGWYDAGQEEYLPENKAREFEFKSPINGKPLVKKSEKNYFFRLSGYSDGLLAHLDEHPDFLIPPARKNELIGRIEEGLNDVPISRTGADGWGIPMPGDETHTIYVWIDALFNYLTTVDTDDRRAFWPCTMHLLAKDILWFHAAIWPAMLMALGKCPGYEWVGLPGQVCAHSFWIAEGRKMSKSLGNFVDMERIQDYVERFGVDALRYFLAGYGPVGASDRDFAEARFIEAYNKELANVVGNGVNRVATMVGKYCDGTLPEPGDPVPEAEDLRTSVHAAYDRYVPAMDSVRLDQAVEAAVDVFRAMDVFIDRTQPFKRAKDPAEAGTVRTILRECTEAIRIGSTLLSPIMPERMGEVWRRYGFAEPAPGVDSMAAARAWSQVAGGTSVEKGDPLFARYQPPA